MTEIIGCDLDRIENDCYDSHQGETYCNILSYNKEKLLIGYIDYSIFEEEIHVKMIEVRTICKRKGIASKMMEKLEEQNLPINIGRTTGEGTPFIEKYKERKRKK